MSILHKPHFRGGAWFFGNLNKRLCGLCKKALIVLSIAVLSMFGIRPVSKFNQELTAQEAKTAQRLQQMVSFLSKEIGIRNYQNYQNLDHTSQWIAGVFKQIGYNVKILSFDSQGQTFKNIVAESAYENFSKDVIIIGAHYDSCFNPGADDNASGVAGLIELARLLKDIPLKQHLRFVAFVNEEPPFFHTDQMGSLVYAKHVQSNGEKVKAAIILEMLGFYSEKPFSQIYLPLLGPFYPNQGNFIAIVGNFKSKEIVNNLYSGFKTTKRFPVERLISPEWIPGINFSDHWSFWQVGIPAVMVTDTAYLRNPHYHQQTDLPETLDFKKMAKVIFGLKDALLVLD